jgi:hypothetical protein
VASAACGRTVDDVGDAGLDVAVGEQLHGATARDRVGVAGEKSDRCSNGLPTLDFGDGAGRQRWVTRVRAL